MEQKNRSETSSKIVNLLEIIGKKFGDKVIIASKKDETEKTDHNSLDSIRSVIRNNYNLEVLKNLYSQYLHHFYIKKDGKEHFQTDKFKKEILVEVLAHVYSDKNLFQNLLSFLPDDVTQILNIIVWEGGEHDSERFMKDFGISILKEEKRAPYGDPINFIDKRFLLFNFKSQYEYRGFGKSPYKLLVFLDNHIRKIFKENLPQPQGYNLNITELFEKTDFVYCDDNYILKNFELLKNYILQGYVKFGKNGKVLKNSIQQMTSYCQIKEFYDHKNKSLQHIRVQIMLNFLLEAPLKSSPDDEILLLKKLFNGFFNNELFKNYILSSVLTHIKGTIYSYDYNKRREAIKKSLLDLLKALPVFGWVSIENIFKYCMYRDIYLDVIDKSYMRNNLYFRINSGNEEKREYYYPRYNRVDIMPDIYNQAVIEPFLKGMMFLFASFGIIDIAYDYPENRLFKEKDKEYLTAFDGLRYVRLTHFGSYITGLTDDYKVNIKKEEAQVILDDTRLIIKIEGKDPLKEMLLTNLSDKISENSYKVTYQSFFKECISEKDINQKIKRFREHIANNPPQIWEDFFKNLQNKIDPLIYKKSLQVYELKHDNELINIFVKDEILKKYILKGEKYHIIMNENDRPIIKKRLVELGYLINHL